MVSQANILIRHKERSWTLGLALASIAYVILGICLTAPRFAANDNLMILDFLIHGYPVPYCGILFTSLLHLAYQALPSVPWYALSLYSLHALSVFIWLKLLRKAFKPWWLALALMAALLIYYIQYLALLDYTSTSIMLCMSSLCYAMVEALGNTLTPWRSAALGLVFMLGMLVRTYGAVGALAFAIPTVMVIVFLRIREYASLKPAHDAHTHLLPMAVFASLMRFQWKPIRTEALRLALIAFMFFAPALTDLAVDTAYRQLTLTPQEARYDEFNAYRSRIHSVNNQERFALMRDRPLLQAIHWNQTDMGHFLNWSYLDERVYTTEAVRTIAENLPPQQISLSDVAMNALQSVSKLDPLFLLLIAPLPLLLLSAWRRPWPDIISLSWPMYCLMLIEFMSMHFTFLDRVSLPFEAAFGFSNLILAGLITDTYRPSGDRIHVGALIVVFFIVLMGLSGLTNKLLHYRQSNLTNHARLDSKLQVLNDSYAGSVVLLQAGPGLLMERSNPFDITWPRFQVIDLGWSTYSPRYYQQIGALGIQESHQLLDTLIVHPDSYLLGTKGWCESLLYFATDSAKRNIRVVAVKTFEDGTGLYRYQETKP